MCCSINVLYTYFTIRYLDTDGDASPTWVGVVISDGEALVGAIVAVIVGAQHRIAVIFLW